MEITHKEFLAVMRHCDERHKSPMLLGPTGEGKSALVRQFTNNKAERLRLSVAPWNKMTVLEKRHIAARDGDDAAGVLTCENVRHRSSFIEPGEAEDGSQDVVLKPSQVRARTMVFADYRLGQVSDTSEFRMPDISGKQSYVEWKPTNIFYLCSLEDAYVVLFMDEFGQAMPQIQSASFQIVLDREIGDVSFGPHTTLCAASNRVEDRANVFEMPVPLRRRFVNYTLRPSSGDEWVAWASESGLDGRVVSFIQNFPDKLRDKMDIVQKLRHQGFACPATWHAVSDLVRGMTPKASEGDVAYNRKLNEIRVLASGAVGQAHGEVFTAHVKTAATIDYESLFVNPAQMDGWGVDLKWTVICGLVEIKTGLPIQ